MKTVYKWLQILDCINLYYGHFCINQLLKRRGFFWGT
jgi:hypothetical protein